MNKRNGWSVLADIITVILSLIWVAPLFFALLISIRPTSDPLGTGNIFFGRTITLENYQRALELAPWQWHYLTSILVVVGVLVVQLITITMAGYAFARMKFWGRNALLFILLIQLMIPSGVLVVQNLNIMRQINLFDTRWALMMPYWGSVFGVLLMRQTFREIPPELEEAARIDGANLFQILRFVYIPLSIPTYVAFALVSVSARWNEFLWPAMVTRTAESRPVTTGLSQLFSATEAGTNYGQLMAGTILVVAPLVVLFIFFQRRFIESFASSGLK
ncbi:MAG: ABC transporter permease [Phototrophicales bacterium]|nr:MAG: ABC transporter permease [Phototrophicales bacterium]